jgi:hypothetical protein
VKKTKRKIKIKTSTTQQQQKTNKKNKKTFRKWVYNSYTEHYIYFNWKKLMFILYKCEQDHNKQNTYILLNHEFQLTERKGRILL